MLSCVCGHDCLYLEMEFAVRTTVVWIFYHGIQLCLFLLKFQRKLGSEREDSGLPRKISVDEFRRQEHERQNSGRTVYVSRTSSNRPSVQKFSPQMNLTEICDEVVQKTAVPTTDFIFTDLDHSTQVLENLNELRKSGDFCDVTLVVDAVKFPCHKVVLAVTSPYFKAMFMSSLVESKQNAIVLKGVEPEVVGLLVEYAYTNHIVITRANVQALLSAANLFQILAVKEAACSFLQNHIDCSNSIGIYCFAELHACTNLQHNAKEYTLQHFGDVYLNEEILNISCEKLVEILSDDKLYVRKEESVFEAILRWCNHNPSVRAAHFPKLLETVRLGLVSPYYLVDCIEKSCYMNNSVECLKLIEQAKLYHLLPDRKNELPVLHTKPRLMSDTVEVIVAVGGEDDKLVLRAVECFYLETRSWKSLACLPFAVSKHGIVTSGRKQMYVAGGEFPDGGSSHFVWRYDPQLDNWQEVESMLSSRSEVALAILDGYIYAIGGWDGSTRLDSVERYDLRLNCWDYVAPLKSAPLTSAAAIGHDGLLYVCGGALHDGDGVDIVQCYDPRTNSWSQLTSMSIKRSGAAACVLDSRIYVIGGWNENTENTNLVEAYNIKTNTWEVKASLNEKRYRPGVAVIDKKIYVLGGEETWDKYHDSVEVYDQQTDSWAICGKLLTPRSWLGCVSLQVKKSNGTNC